MGTLMRGGVGWGTVGYGGIEPQDGYVCLSLGFSHSKQARPGYPLAFVQSPFSARPALCSLLSPGQPRAAPRRRRPHLEYLSKCQVHSDGWSSRQVDGTFESSVGWSKKVRGGGAIAIRSR